MIGEGSFPHWPAATNLITFTRKVGDQYEVFVMKPDGSGKRQVTHFCDKGYPDYDPKSEQDANRKAWGAAGTRITEMCFSPDGRQVLIGRCQAETHKLGEAESGNLEALKTLTDVPSFLYVVAISPQPRD